MKQTLTMRRSRVLEKLRKGEVACSIKVNVSNAAALEIAALHDFDCVWTCLEHVPQTYEEIRTQLLVCKAYDVDLMVRIARGSYSDYIRPFEMDASAIMVPHIQSLADAKQVVYMTRFHPQGRRALDGGNADGKYCVMPVSEYLETSNREKMVVLQIEDPEPLQDIEAICELPDYDVIYFGPGDFAHAIGQANNLMHPDVVAARRLVAKTANKYGKLLGTVSVGEQVELLDEGYRFLNIGSDVYGLGSYYGDIRERFERLLQSRG